MGRRTFASGAVSYVFMGVSFLECKNWGGDSLNKSLQTDLLSFHSGFTAELVTDQKQLCRFTVLGK